MSVTYKTEGNINFYEELYKSLDSKEEEETDIGEVCLITNQPLSDNFVVLECNHKFNYVPLYNDIANHKKKYNNMENKQLKNVEIRCPYCRNIQKTLLPFHENMGVKKTHGVNFFDENYGVSKIQPSSKYVHGDCSYTENNVACQNKYVFLLELDSKLYCSVHATTIVKNITMANKIKIQKEKQAEKLLAKQQAAEAKLAAKQQAVEAKLVAKQQAAQAKLLAKKPEGKKIKKETSQENMVVCIQLLKTGPNKGQQCGCKATQNNLCSRHYKVPATTNN